jgi:hypothetical protein
VSGIFFTSPLTKRTTSGSAWAKVDASFPELQVFANVLLSAYSTQAPQQFSSFQTFSAESYIVTPQTPMTSVGGISIPSRRDNTVYVKTSRLTFWLQVNNGGSLGAASASAVGAIYDTTPTAAFALAPAVQHLDLAVYAEDGTVVATSRSRRIEGGPAFDEDETRETVLAEAYAISKRQQGSLKIAAFGYDEMPTDTDFRVNPSTGLTEPLPPPDRTAP